MAKLQTIKAPALTKEGKYCEIDISGQVANLYLGDDLIKCFIQYEEGKPSVLSHFETRLKFPRSFSEQSVSDLFGRGESKSARKVAQRILDHLTAVYGVEKVRSTIAKALPFKQRESV